ncbi:MAG TPA: SH3 domain-containing protein [Feifaniaceae bacterium]|nr:SH3 domain-containing protein [Feifaniaceae bacterium]
MLKKLIAAVLTATTMLLLAVPALAATTQTAGYRIATTNVNVRTGPSSTKYPAIGYLVKGELVSFVSKSGDWSKIAFKGTTGYVFSKYLTDPLSQTPKYYRSATEPVNVRTGPDSGKYPIISSLKKGETVQYLGDSGNWAMVLHKNRIGFVFSKYLTRPTTGGGGGSTPAPTPTEYRVATTAVNVRTGPSSVKYPAMGYLDKGESVQYLGASGDWSKVLFYGKVGYVYSKYLVKQPIFEDPVKVTEKSGSVQLQLVLNKSTFKANEPIECYAVLKNIGGNDKLKLYGTRQLVYFPIKSVSGNKLFNGEYSTTLELAETVVTKSAPLTYNFVKTGSLSPDASDKFVREYFSTNTLRLPAGKYAISAEMNYATTSGGQIRTLDATAIITVK